MIMIFLKNNTKSTLNSAKNYKIKWAFTMNDTVYLKRGAQDIYGNYLNIRLEYFIRHRGDIYSVISNGYCDIVINNKYIKNLPRA